MDENEKEELMTAISAAQAIMDHHKIHDITKVVGMMFFTRFEGDNLEGKRYRFNSHDQTLTFLYNLETKHCLACGF